MTTTPSAAPTKVTLRLLEKTDREIVKLDRAIVGAVCEFQHDFRANPRHPGLRLKQLEGHDRLYSARVNADYRALLLHLSESEWLLVAVKHRGHAYENLDRLSYGINQVTGGIDCVNLEIVEWGMLRRGRPQAAPAASSAASEPTRQRPLFADVTPQQLVDLGVAEPLVPVVARLTSDEELLGLVEYAPRHTGEVLLRLRDVPYQQVLEEATRPVEVEDIAPRTTRRRSSAPTPRSSRPTRTSKASSRSGTSDAGRSSSTPPRNGSRPAGTPARPASAVARAPARRSSRCTA